MNFCQEPRILLQKYLHDFVKQYLVSLKPSQSISNIDNAVGGRIGRLRQPIRAVVRYCGSFDGRFQFQW